MLVQLRDITKILSGYPFRAGIQASPEGGVAVVQMKDLDPVTGLQPEKLTYVSSLGSKAEKYFLNPGDIVFQSKGNNNTAAVINVDFDTVAAIGLYVLRPDTTILSSEFLCWSINHPRTQKQLKILSVGTYIPFIKTRDLRRLQITVPSKNVQDKILKLTAIQQKQQLVRKQLDEVTERLIQGITWQLASEQMKLKETE